MSSSPPIGVIGNVCVDLVLRDVAELPAWGEEVAASAHEVRHGGQGFHVASALARLGHEVRLAAAVGDDAWGTALLDDLARAGVVAARVPGDAGEPATTRAEGGAAQRTDGGAAQGADGGLTRGAVSGAARRTALTVALVRPDGERAFVSDFAGARELRLEHVERAWGGFARCAALCVVGLFNLPGLGLADAGTILRRARVEGRLTAFDPGWDPEGWTGDRVTATLDVLDAVDVFLPNLDEARLLTGHEEPEPAARALANRARTVVVKCGSDGAVAVSGGALHRVGALPVTAVDAVGAGDTFDAAFLAALLHGHAVSRSLAIASASAGLFVSRRADRHPTMDEAIEASARLPDV